MPSTLQHLVDLIRADHFAFPTADANAIGDAQVRGVPDALLNFFRLCDGAFIGDGDDFVSPDGRRFRLAIPRLTDLQTVQSFGYVFDDAPLYELTAHWWQIVDYGDSNWLAFDASTDGNGRIIDVFHETVGEPDSHDVVAASLTGLLERLLAKSDVYWFDDNFEALSVV